MLLLFASAHHLHQCSAGLSERRHVLSSLLVEDPNAFGTELYELGSPATLACRIHSNNEP